MSDVLCRKGDIDQPLVLINWPAGHFIFVRSLHHTPTKAVLMRYGLRVAAPGPRMEAMAAACSITCTAVTPSSLDLKELAKQAIDQGEIEAAKFLLGKIDPPQPGPAAPPSYANAKATHAKAEVDLAVVKLATAKPKVATVQPVLIAETALPGLCQSQFLDQPETDFVVTEFLRKLDQHPFRFNQVADYLINNYSNALDPVYMAGDKTPKWRRQISNSLADFCIKGWLKKAQKPKTHYRITSLFFELKP